MDRTMLNALTERMAALEAELIRWKTVGVAALVTLGLVVLVWGPWGRPAQAGEAGVKEYNLTVPSEVFQAGQARHVEELRTRRVVLVDARGEARGSLQVSTAGTPSLELFGQGGRTQAALSVKGSGSPSLVLYDRMGRVLWRAP